MLFMAYDITSEAWFPPSNTPMVDLKMRSSPRVPYVFCAPWGIIKEAHVRKIVSGFLADAYPSHLIPSPSDGKKAALARARINFFVDTWFSKAGSYWMQILRKDTAEEKEALSKEFLAVIGKEIEPLLKDANPFFGGSSKLTLAEVRISRISV